MDATFGTTRCWLFVSFNFSFLFLASFLSYRDPSSMSCLCLCQRMSQLAGAILHAVYSWNTFASLL